MHVFVIMKHKDRAVVTTGPDRTIASLAGLLTTHRIGAVPVTGEDGALVGIIGERDIVRGIAEHGAAALSLPVERLMVTGAPTCRPTDTIREVMSVMTSQRVRHLPVIDDGRLRGIISIGDVVKQRLEAIESEAEDLRGYVTGVELGNVAMFQR